MADESTKEVRKSARLKIMEMAHMISLPMSLNALIRLNVPQAIWQSGSNSPLTPTQILSLLDPPPPSSASPSNLQRLLRLLCTHHIFSEHLIDGQHHYNLTNIGQTLVPNEANGGSSYAAFILQHHQDALVRAWPLVHEAVLDPEGPEAFARVNGGVPAYEYYGTDDEANELMRKVMMGVSVPFMEAFLEEYRGFEGAETIVDVGGSSGACLQMILRKVDGVKNGINFDLPEVVAGAPKFPGVTHVGGDMLKSIPGGDVILMKLVLVTRTDEECVLILKNCYEALPAGGKLIVIDPVMPEEADGSQKTRALLGGDIFVMTIYSSQGRKRTEEEHRQLGLSAGFPGFRPIYLDHFFTVMEFHK